MILGDVDVLLHQGDRHPACPTRRAGCAALNTGWDKMIWSPTPGRLWCRTLTKVEVPPRTISRIVMARVMFGPDALAAAIPAVPAINAAEAAAMAAPLPKRHLMCSMLVPLWVAEARSSARRCQGQDRQLPGRGRGFRVLFAGHEVMVVLSWPVA